MPFIKDVPNKKFQRRIRAWNVLDVVNLRNDQVKIVTLYYNSLQGEQLEILKKIISLSDHTGKTNALSMDDFKEFPISKFKTNVTRLIKKGLIKRGNFQKKGRGGFFSFELTKSLQQLLSQSIK